MVGLQDVQPTAQLSRDEEFFQTQYGLLKSYSLAERVGQSLGLGNDPTFLHEMGIRGSPAPAPGGGSPAWVTGFLQGGLNVLPVRDSRLVRITFDSPDPELSARVANAFADNFINPTWSGVSRPRPTPATSSSSAWPS